MQKHQHYDHEDSPCLSEVFGITDEDVMTVLCGNALHVTNSDGKPFEVMAAELLGDIDHEAVALAAINASTDVDEQTTAAHLEITRQLVTMGVLKGRHSVTGAGETSLPDGRFIVEHMDRFSLPAMRYRVTRTKWEHSMVDGRVIEVYDDGYDYGECDRHFSTRISAITGLTVLNAVHAKRVGGGHLHA